MQTIVYNICNTIFVYDPVLLNHDDDEQVVGLVVVSSLIGRQPNQETTIFSLLTECIIITNVPVPDNVGKVRAGSYCKTQSLTVTHHD